MIKKLCIEEIFAFIAVDPDDNTEGIVAAAPDGTHWFPLVSADQGLIDNFLRPIAENIAKQTNGVIHLVKFSTREVLEEIKP